MEAFTDHTVDADAAGFLEAFHPEAIKTACRWAAVLIAYVLYRCVCVCLLQLISAPINRTPNHYLIDI